MIFLQRCYTNALRTRQWMSDLSDVEWIIGDIFAACVTSFDRESLRAAMGNQEASNKESSTVVINF